MGFPENEWHGHDLTTLIDGAARRLWGRLKDVNAWDDLNRVDQTRVKEAALPNVLDVLDVIHEHELAQHAPEAINCRFFTGDPTGVHELTSCITCEALKERIAGIVVQSDDLDQAVDQILAVLPKATVIPAGNQLLDGLDEILSEYELSGQGFSASEYALERISALTADARNGFQEV